MADQTTSNDNTKMASEISAGDFQPKENTHELPETTQRAQDVQASDPPETTFENRILLGDRIDTSREQGGYHAKGSHSQDPGLTTDSTLVARHDKDDCSFAPSEGSLQTSLSDIAKAAVDRTNAQNVTVPPMTPSRTQLSSRPHGLISDIAGIAYRPTTPVSQVTSMNPGESPFRGRHTSLLSEATQTKRATESPGQAPTTQVYNPGLTVNTTLAARSTAPYSPGKGLYGFKHQNLDSPEMASSPNSSQASPSTPRTPRHRRTYTTLSSSTSGQPTFLSSEALLSSPRSSTTHSRLPNIPEGPAATGQTEDKQTKAPNEEGSERRDSKFGMSALRAAITSRSSFSALKKKNKDKGKGKGKEGSTSDEENDSEDSSAAVFSDTDSDSDSDEEISVATAEQNREAHRSRHNSQRATREDKAKAAAARALVDPENQGGTNATDFEGEGIVERDFYYEREAEGEVNKGMGWQNAEQWGVNKKELKDMKKCADVWGNSS